MTLTDTGGPFNLSVVLPVCNEESILEENVLALERHLAGMQQLDGFEILLVCNGCRDGSVRISERLADKVPGRIRTLCLDTRGLGHAVRAGISASSFDFVMFYAVDLPFGLTVFDESVAAARENRNRIVIGSKGHADSHVERSVPRWMFSRVISFLNNLLFDLDVKDTQGSLLFPKAVFRRHHAAMDSPGAFFQAQIVIYGRQIGCEMLEIPVRLFPRDNDHNMRFALIVDGAHYISAIFREKFKLATGAARTKDSRS